MQRDEQAGNLYRRDLEKPLKTALPAGSRRKASSNLAAPCRSPNTKTHPAGLRWEKRKRTIILNFSHPLSAAQRAQIEALAGTPIETLHDLSVQFDSQLPFEPQLTEMVQRVPLSPPDWQTAPLLIVLPALNFIAALLLADLHGRMGYFPTIVRTRPVVGSTPPAFEVAELLNLQALRNAARKQR